MKLLFINLLFLISINCFSQITLVDNNIKIEIYQEDFNDSLSFKFNVINISNNAVYIPLNGFCSLTFESFDKSVLILDLGYSKLGKGNPHYFSTLLNLEQLNPNSTKTFNIVVNKSVAEKYKLKFNYEYLLKDKKRVRGNYFNKNLMTIKFEIIKNTAGNNGNRCTSLKKPKN